MNNYKRFKKSVQPPVNTPQIIGRLYLFKLQTHCKVGEMIANALETCGVCLHLNH